MAAIKIYTGDAIEQLRRLPPNSIHCAVTSPPYYGLRDYKIANQIGLEETAEAYVAKLVEVFRELRRVLRDDGTLWLNLGDTYAGPGGYSPNAPSNKAGSLQSHNRGAAVLDPKDRRTRIKAWRNGASGTDDDLKAKQLMGIPWRVAFALQADGWWLRQDIIWAKQSCMPEPVTDRCTRSHEYVFMLAKQPRYFYDWFGIAERSVTWDEDKKPTETLDDLMPNPRKLPASGNRNRKLPGERGALRGFASNAPWTGTMRNKRDVWFIGSTPIPDSHFAVFPTDLVRACVMAGTSDYGVCAKCGAPYERKLAKTTTDYSGGKYAQRVHGEAVTGRKKGAMASSKLGSSHGKAVGSYSHDGWSATCQCKAARVPATVLDPFAGSGTVGVVAEKLGRNAVLIELNPSYTRIMAKRLAREVGLTTEITTAKPIGV